MNTATEKEILDALMIADLPREEQEDLLLTLGDVVFQGSMIRMIAEMDEPIQEEFEKLMEQNPSEEEVSAFLELHIPNADAIVQDTLDELRSDILAVTS